MKGDFISGSISMEINHKPITILRCKLLVVGDGCVGKTALTQVFTSGGTTYPKNYLMTIGVEFSVKQVPIPDTNIIVELYIYDCNGQSIFNQLEENKKYYENATAVAVVYNVANKESFQSIVKWKQVLQRAKVEPGVGALIGNQCEHRKDPDVNVEVTEEEAKTKAKLMKYGYFETSAAKNKGIEEPFFYIANEFYKMYEETTGPLSMDN